MGQYGARMGSGRRERKPKGKQSARRERNRNYVAPGKLPACKGASESCHLHTLNMKQSLYIDRVTHIDSPQGSTKFYPLHRRETEAPKAMELVIQMKTCLLAACS